MPILYIIRHCKAAGQAPDAALTAVGRAQAAVLADFLHDKQIEAIMCSPFLRAIQSIEPLAERLNLAITTETRLAERVLSREDLPDWMEHLRHSYTDLDCCLPGGESSRTAMNRIAQVVNELQRTAAHQRIAVVTHGNLMSLLLRQYDPQFGFDQWLGLSNPDVYSLTISGQGTIVRREWQAEEYK